MRVKSTLKRWRTIHQALLQKLYFSCIFFNQEQLGPYNGVITDSNKDSFISKIYKLSAIDHIIQSRMVSSCIILAYSLLNFQQLPKKEDDLTVFWLEKVKIRTDFYQSP